MDDAIGREIKLLRDDVREDIAGLRTDLGRLVSREVHEAMLGRLADRVSTVERDLDRLVSAIETDRKTEAVRRDTAAADRRADRRVVLGAVLAALLSIAVNIMSATGTLP